ncbi:hypothetical protein [Caenimonas aquaedulcis]|uniref:Uncharacterized protein n=1 Tax=Caenimonas aquaedulcis TaxID=2793270 RepID=A0A931H5H6_9BURK|nr:hypothetical protein [Caenimonas aquaedulcis]MBG9388918.1 hypothetical protein [Caenimonas aquaedulcis]
MRQLPSTVRDALAGFYARQDLPGDGGSTADRWAIAPACVRITLPNFAWRAKALPVHDLHHLLTGYECSPWMTMPFAALAPTLALA